MSFQLSGKRIWIAGHRGMVGAAVMRRLERENCTLLSADRSELDLTNQAQTFAWIADNKPDAVVLAAAKVGGIHANNSFPAEFLNDNIVLQSNVIHGSYLAGVRKLMFLGSSCIYPKMAPQPINEDHLLTGPLEPTNEWYAIAKIAGLKMCQAYRRQYGVDYISAMPTNLYGPGDNYNLETSHVLPALIRKFHTAKISNEPEVTLWGSGTPLREFLHVDDLADALVFLLKEYSDETHINVGSGSEITIKGLAEQIAQVVGYDANLEFDPSKPDGTPRKLMDSGRLHALGWNNARTLLDGLRSTYQDFKMIDLVD